MKAIHNPESPRGDRGNRPETRPGGEQERMYPQTNEQPKGSPRLKGGEEVRLMQGDIGSDTSVRLIHRDYLVKGYSIRFMYRDTIFPNIEFKFSSTTIHGYAITNSYKAIINNEHVVKISPPELQIAYKLYLGSDKDIGDAVYLYTILRDNIDSSELEKWCRELGVNCSILEGA